MTTNDADKVFAGSIPEIYDEYLVPLIFEPYATDLAGRLSAFKPESVLETAAGTGVLTRALAASFPDAAIAASDLNQPMLDRAAARFGRSARVTWQHADALALPFADESFDAVACQFGVMFFPDKIRGYKEARRVLKRGRPFAFNVWDHIERNELVAVVSEALETFFPDDPPRFMARTPHGYHDADEIRRHLGDAGFIDIVIERVNARSRAPSAYDAAFAFCQGTPWRAEIEARGGAGGLQKATQHAADALIGRFGAGPIEGGIAALVVMAR
ncbi:methyltransferase domain-containing protein [Bradyrhizobium sp. LHD-71]|uniref:class I SAM-dependent methyltransferase n=1 Tax=Bradyrhizobium sp. LHD-71 TaxID=3072141 RepID=UPI00280F42BB|nr:methyltransferase domain-containing protein [Bradyrhizobium sp. LHD-71]MDQ8729394.1 methyltransferase domain-containing protein [Bradyrhizobium sp. LHD-71]